jgi:hypothetical protein
MTTTLWAIYDRPAEFPLGFLAREHEIRPGEYRPTGNVLRSMDLATLRRILRDEKGKQIAHHFTKTEATLLEVWM